MDERRLGHVEAFGRVYPAFQPLFLGAALFRATGTAAYFIMQLRAAKDWEPENHQAQLAHIHGARVITTVSGSNIALVKSLGADEALDYRGRPFEVFVREIDLVFDTVGGDTLRRSWQVLKPDGRLVTVAVDSESTSDERVRQAFFIVEPNREQLAKVGKLLEAGKLQTALDTVLPVSAATEAYTGTVARQGRGKLVISTRQLG